MLTNYYDSLGMPKAEGRRVISETWTCPIQCGQAKPDCYTYCTQSGKGYWRGVCRDSICCCATRNVQESHS